MADLLSPVPKLQFFDSNGKPAVGYKLFTYSAGTSTKLATYTDSSGNTSNPNPIILDYRGEANVWIPPNVSYKYVFCPPNDTDPPSSPIWSVDNVVSDQLLTLFGGVDTGSADNYVLNFDAPYSSYEDGIVIYWIPANTNTGPSTLNVNGLGPIAIVNPSGGALIAGQIIANQFAAVGYLNGDFVLLSFNNIYLAGSFTGTLTGCTTTPTANFDFVRNGNLVSLYCNTGLVGVSNADAMTITGLPESIRPVLGRNTPCIVEDNGAFQVGWVNISNSTTLTFSANGSPTGFTTSGNKGIGGQWMVTYTL